MITSHTVWVIMGNDYPDAVFADEEKANAYIDKRKKEDEEKFKRQLGYGVKVYWRAYEFELQT